MYIFISMFNSFEWEKSLRFMHGDARKVVNHSGKVCGSCDGLWVTELWDCDYNMQ